MEFSSDLIIGSVLLALSVYTLVARQVAPGHFAKLEAMKQQWGDKKGVALHIFGYTLLPFVAGSLMLFNELS